MNDAVMYRNQYVLLNQELIAITLTSFHILFDVYHWLVFPAVLDIIIPFLLQNIAIHNNFY